MNGVERHTLLQELKGIQSFALELSQKCESVIDVLEEGVVVKEWLTTKEVGDIVGLKPKTIANYISIGVFTKVKKKGSRNLIHKSEVISFKG